MKFEFDGRTRELDVDDPLMSHSLVITAYTGLSLVAWERSLLQLDSPAWLKSIRAAYWLMLAQAGEDAKITDVDFRVGTFSTALIDAWTAELEAAAAAKAEPEDPTRPAGEPGETSPPGPVAGSTGSLTAT